VPKTKPFKNLNKLLKTNVVPKSGVFLPVTWSLCSKKGSWVRLAHSLIREVYTSHWSCSWHRIYVHIVGGWMFVCTYIWSLLTVKMCFFQVSFST
jgi:hypothetical protein